MFAVHLPADAVAAFIILTFMLFTIGLLLWGTFGEVLFGIDSRRASRRIHHEHACKKSKPKLRFSLRTLFLGVGVFQLSIASAFAMRAFGLTPFGLFHETWRAEDIVWATLLFLIIYGVGGSLLWYCISDEVSRRRTSARGNRTPERRSSTEPETFLDQLATGEGMAGAEEPPLRRKRKKKRWWGRRAPEAAKTHYTIWIAKD